MSRLFSNSVISGAAISTLVVALSTFTSSYALAGDDRLTCYQSSDFPDSVLVLNIKKHSSLTSNERSVSGGFEGGDQTAYDAHGKDVNVCGSGTLSTTTGTIVVSKDREGNRGSHLGLTTHSVKGIGPIETCFPVTYDCTSSEISPAPQTWQCSARNERPRFFPSFTLTKLDPENPLCQTIKDRLEDSTSVSIEGRGL